MSDGLANRGLTDTKAISQRAQQTSQRGVTTTTMGVGTDYNEDLMTALADYAGGNYYFIQDSKQIANVFKEELRKRIVLKLFACMQDEEQAESLVAWFQQNAETDGIEATPTFILNGKVMDAVDTWAKLEPALKAAGA